MNCPKCQGYGVVKIGGQWCSCRVAKDLKKQVARTQSEIEVRPFSTEPSIELTGKAG